MKTSGRTLKGFNTDVEDVLFKAGYTKHIIKEKGYVRQIDATHRFHAYITAPDRVQIHTDVFSKDGKTYGSNYKFNEEFNHLIRTRNKIIRCQKN
jgi:hypothetical protein